MAQRKSKKIRTCMRIVKFHGGPVGGHELEMNTGGAKYLLVPEIRGTFGSLRSINHKYQALDLYNYAYLGCEDPVEDRRFS